jgi:hypothetical protein
MKTNSILNKSRTQGNRTLAFRSQSTDAPAALRGKLMTIASCLFVMLMVAGCASTKVTSGEQNVTGQLPRPGNIWVYDFAATPSDVPADSWLSSQNVEHDTPQTAEQIATGRQIGSEIASALVEEIRNMGLPAERAWPGTAPQINDIVIKGYLISVQEGDAKKRVAIGLGSGSSELRTAVEGFQVTAQGLRKLGSGTLSSESGKTPGGVVGLATLLATHNPAGLIISTGAHVYGEKSGKSTVEGRAKQTAKEIGDVLKKRFQQEGWID